MCKVTESLPPFPSNSHRPGSAKQQPSLVLIPQPQQPQQPQAQESSSRRRRVRFGDNEEHVFEKEFTDEDLNQIWYNVDEFAAIKSEIYAMARSLNANDETEQERQWHWRGFEYLLHRRPRKEIRRKHSEELLYFYNVMKVQDPDGLRLLLVGGNTSRDCSERARELGISDESEAFAIYKEQDNDDDEVPEAASVTDDSSSSEEEDSEELVGLYLDASAPVVPATICRYEGVEDEKAVSLLHQDVQTIVPSGVEMASLLYVPYRLVHMLFPCVC